MAVSVPGLGVRQAIVAVIVLVGLSDHTSEAVKGPPRARNNTVVHRVRVGDVVRLSCSVDSDSPLIVMWLKDDRTIHIGWERFKVNEQDHGLRIRNATLGDRGRYVCRAANGFGSVEIEHTVHIAWSRPANIPNETFVYLTPSVGESLRLQCLLSNGSHSTVVTWYKDGVVLDLQELADKYTLLSDASLTLNVVTSDESGVYDCRFRAGNGEFNVTYVVDVVGKPVFVRPPANVTATLGSPVSFFCHVRSQIPAHILWLKRTEGMTEGGVIHSGDSRFLAIQGTRFVHLSNGSYLSKLQIQSVRVQDAGLYVCTCTNIHGYITGAAYLAISQPDTTDVNDTDLTRLDSPILPQDSPVLSLVVVLSVLAVLVLFFVLAYLVYRSQFGAKSLADGSYPDSVEKHSGTAPQLDPRSSSASFLATPDFNRRFEHHHYVSVASALEGENVCGVPCDPCRVCVSTSYPMNAGSQYLTDYTLETVGQDPDRTMTERTWLRSNFYQNIHNPPRPRPMTSTPHVTHQHSIQLDFYDDC